MVSSSSPTVLKRWIAYELRRLRESSDYSRQDAAERIGKATSQIGHLENMRNLPSMSDVEVLLTWYGHGDRVEFFRDLLKQAKKGRDWWVGFSDVTPEWFSLYLGLESSAVQIESYDATVVPGILQTPDYAEAIIRGGAPTMSEEAIARQIELRLARQELLERAEEPPQVWRILDESVLRRTVGGPTTMRRQLEHLVKLYDRPNIDIQVLPHSAGAHTGMEGTFTILSFPGELIADPGVVYVQTRIKGIYYEDTQEILEYRDALNRLRVQALSPEQSRDLISEIAEEL